MSTRSTIVEQTLGGWDGQDSVVVSLRGSYVCIITFAAKSSSRMTRDETSASVMNIVRAMIIFRITSSNSSTRLKSDGAFSGDWGEV